jgi:hypothetical protein
MARPARQRERHPRHRSLRVPSRRQLPQAEAPGLPRTKDRAGSRHQLLRVRSPLLLPSAARRRARPGAEARRPPAQGERAAARPPCLPRSRRAAAGPARPARRRLARRGAARCDLHRRARAPLLHWRDTTPQPRATAPSSAGETLAQRERAGGRSPWRPGVQGADQAGASSRDDALGSDGVEAEPEGQRGHEVRLERAVDATRR